MPVELTENLLSNAAGWEAMKRARAYLAQGQVLSSFWEPPLLRGVVQTPDGSFRASLVIKSGIDMENLCTCRDSRQWGKICAHVVGVGLHWLQQQQAQSAAATVSGPSAGSISRQLPPKRTSTLARDASGEPVEISIVLPPNLPDAIGRGRVMLVLEALRSGSRCPLNALPRDRSYAFPPADVLFLDRIESLAGGDTPSLLQLPTADFASLLPLLADNKNVTVGKTKTLEVSRSPLELPITADLQTNGEIILSLKGKPAGLIIFNGWVWTGSGLQTVALPPTAAGLLDHPVRLTREQVPVFLGRDWPQMQAAGAQANFLLQDFSLGPQEPRFLLHLSGGLAQLQALLQCAYGARIMTLGVTGAEETVWLPDPANPTRYSTRDLTAERSALARLQRSGFTGPDTQGRLLLAGQNAVLNFFAREYPHLEREWQVSLEERLQRSASTNIERIEPRFQITSSGVQWFDLGVVFAASDGQTFSPAEVQQLLLSGQSHTRLRNGKIAVIDTESVNEFQEVLRDCAPQQHGNGYRISNAQSAFLEATLRQHGNWKLQAPREWRERAVGQSGEVRPVCPPLGDLERVLRPYQKEGVAWLNFLRQNRFGGILADEMGLGKTLQALAFIRSLREQHPGSPPVLVICPTSLVYNWEAEAKKFTPALKILALQGPNRHALFDSIPHHDLVITSYALMRRDTERYREFEFDITVLDEAQHIKNRETLNAQAVKAIRSRQRIVLTGTPLENSVLDLWSIFDFLMPGYLGSAQDFRERYELPIIRDKNSQAQSRLARRLRPFLLRRLKKDVASDLPEKLQQVSFCELTPDQRSLYQQIIEASRKEILESVGEQGLARSRMLVLTALLRLRQVCCDLRLLKLEELKPETTSGKLELFSELLEEVIDGGHRVLVFSQFVGMLSLLKARLDAEEIGYCYLDGSTTDRGAVVNRFQADASIPVFLISLKAGGSGLNLTGADTVIHFDPWWNPAVEDQATDRAHRIGQTRVVTSYKLITRDTVEEKILLLQNRKREMIQATIGDEEAFAQTLTWSDIQELLA